MERIQALEQAMQIIFAARCATASTNRAAWEFLRRVTKRIEAEQCKAFAEYETKMSTDTVNIETFANNNGITLTAVRADRNPTMPDSRDMDHWKVTLTRLVHLLRPATGDYCFVCTCGDWGFSWEDSMHFDVNETYADHVTARMKAAKVRMTLYFSKGVGHHGAEPTVSEVLDCLASDAGITENCPTFENFCSELGYDTDSRSAERTYKATVHQTARLRTFLGDDLFETLVWNTERS